MLGKRPRFVPFQQEQRLEDDLFSLLLSNPKSQSSSSSPSPSPPSSSFVRRQVFGFEIAASKEASEWLRNSVTEVSSSSSASHRRSSHGGIAAALLSNQNGSSGSFIPVEVIANPPPSSLLLLPHLPPPPLQQTEKTLALTLAIRNPRGSPDFRDGRIIAKTEEVNGMNRSFIPAEAIEAAPLHTPQQMEKNLTLNHRDSQIAKTMEEEGDGMNRSFIPAEAIASSPSPVPPLQQMEKTLTPNPRDGRIAKAMEEEDDGMTGSFIPAEGIAAAPLQQTGKILAIRNRRHLTDFRDGWIVAKTMGDGKGYRKGQDEDEEKIMEIFPRKNSIFIAAPASPPDSISEGTGNGECCFRFSIDFMKACFFCNQTLTGKDVYMYRGDRAFCSGECRYQQIIIDEPNERRSSMPRMAKSYNKCRALATPTASAA